MIGEHYVIFVTEDRDFYEEFSVYDSPGNYGQEKMALPKIAADLNKAFNNLTEARKLYEAGDARSVGRACSAASFYVALSPFERTFHGRRLWVKNPVKPKPGRKKAVLEVKEAALEVPEPVITVENAFSHETTVKIVKVYVRTSGWEAEVGCDSVSESSPTSPESTLRTITEVIFPRMSISELRDRLGFVQV